MTTGRMRILLALVVAFAAAVEARAGDLTISMGGTVSLAANIGGGANLAAGDSIIVDGATDTNPVIIDVNVDSPALGDGGNAAIQISNGVAVTFNFTGNFSIVLGNADSTAISVSGGGTMAVTGTQGGFNFSANTGQTLTLNGPVTGAVAANAFTIGNNTLTTTTNPVTLNAVSIGGAGAVLDVQSATTIATLTMTGDLNITPADARVLTLTNPLQVGANMLTVTGSGAGGAEALSGTINLDNPASVVTTAGIDADDVLGDATIVVSADGATLDVNFNTTPPAVNQTAANGNLNLQVANGKTLTTTVDVNDNILTLAETGTVSTVQIDTAGGTLQANADAIITTLACSAAGVINLGDTVDLTVTNTIDVGARKLIVNGSGGGGQDTLSATIDLDSSDSELEIGSGAGADVDNINGFTVTVSANGALIDADINTAPTAINMTAGSGDLEIEVAGGKTMTVSTAIDVNDNQLTIASTGTVSAVSIDTDGGIIAAGASGTIGTLTIAADAVINLSNGVNLTLTNPAGVGANALTINGSGGGAQDSLTGTITLDNAASMVTVSGADADNPGGTTFTSTVDGATLDFNISAAPAGITLNGGDLNLLVAANKTLATTTTIGANMLTLGETGNPGTLLINNAGSVLDVNASISPTAVTVSADGTIDVAGGVTLTGNVNIATRNLTLLGAGVLTQITATTGTVTADGNVTITTLTASPGNGNTFTYGGAGNSTVTTIAPLDTANESFTKTGTGMLTATNGFSFASASGIELNVDAGTFVHTGGSSIVFGDANEAINVAAGATYTCGVDMIAQAGGSTQLDAAVGSTVNFSKAGALTLTSTEDDDFTVLGTASIANGCTLTLAGAFQTQWGNINVQNTGTFASTVPGSTMLFVPGSTLALLGTSSGTLNVNGQSSSNRITISTTTGSGTFTFNRGTSANVTFRNVALSNCIYTSTAGGTADSELQLAGVIDLGNTTNWFGELVVSAGPDRTIISGNSTTLEGSATGASSVYTFAWSPATGLSSASVAQPVASPTATTTYTLTVTDSVDPAKVGTDTVTVTVTPPLVASAGEDKTIPPGGSTVLDGSGTGGSGQYRFSWLPTTGLTNADTATPTAAPQITTTYTLTVTDLGDGNRTAIDTVTITLETSVPGAVCGVGICGAGAASMLPLTLLGLGGLRLLNRRRR